MHPSMRDLLIDYLMRHDGERTRFLEVCSPDGFALAISAAGGAEGERRFPLLRSANDWTTLGQRARELLSEADPPGVSMLITALGDALARLQVDRPERYQEAQALSTLTAIGLRTLAERWDRSGEPIPLPQLEHYARASVYVEPLPPMPALRLTWEATAPGSAEDAAQQSVEQLGAWHDLIDVVTRTEPRLFRQIRFPEEYTDVLTAMLDSLLSEVDDMGSIDDPDPFLEEEPEDPDDNNYNESEEDDAAHLDEIGNVLRAFEAVWPNQGLRDRAEALLAQTEEQASIREARTERFREVMLRHADPDPDDHRDYDTHEHEFFDVSRLFSDL
jgi:hypothetical protein